MAELFYHPFQPSAWVEVSGEDAPRFLQGQFSNDLNRTEDRPVTYGLWLDAKGRIQADGFVLGVDADRLIVFSYYSSGAELVARLEKYIIADDVEVVDKTSSVRGFSLWGEDAGTVLDEMGFPVPVEATYAEADGARVIPGRRTKGGSYDVIFNKERRERDNGRIEEALLKRGCSAVGEEACHYERIRSGIPAIPLDLGARNFAHEGGIENIAISYDKGCYLGQEVMSRLRTKGQVRRSLVRAEVNGDVPALPCPVYLGEREAGKMTSSGREGSKDIAFALILRSFLDEAASLSFEPSGERRIRILDFRGNNGT